MGCTAVCHNYRCYYCHDDEGIHQYQYWQKVFYTKSPGYCNRACIFCYNTIGRIGLCRNPVYPSLFNTVDICFYINIKEFNVHNFSEENGIRKRTGNGFEMFPFIISSILYIAVPMSMCNLVIFNTEAGGLQYSGFTLLSMFIILWATDVGAYCLGSTLGQRFGKRLFPSISPKKSWVGFCGGLICAILAAALLDYAGLLAIGLPKAVGLGIIICIFGVWGDLVESQFKRNFGVKDSGSIMPGHGGMLDRFDGALIAFPMAVIYLTLFV